MSQQRQAPIDANHLADPTQLTRGIVPPSDLLAQDALISSAFLLEGARSVIDRAVTVGIEPKHFFGDAYRMVWESILRIEVDGLEIGIVEVAADLRERDQLDRIGGTPFLSTFATSPYELTRIEGHARRIIELWKQREAIAFQQKMIARMYHPQGVKGQDLLEEAESKFWTLAHDQRESSYQSAATIASNELKKMAEAIATGKNILGATTGFEDLDKQTGGYMPGDLIIVAARPGMGKSAYAMSTLLRLTAPPSDGTLPDAGYFHSCEMPREQIALRMVCSLSGVEYTKLRLNHLTRVDWEKLFDGCVELGRHPLFIDDRPSCTLQEFRANVRKIKRDIELKRVPAKSLALAVADYLQLMKGVQGAGREQEISSLSRGLKETAKAEAVCVMALSQLNRDVEKRGGGHSQKKGGDEEGGGNKQGKRPQLSDLRESGAIEQDADSVIFIYREEYYNKEAGNEAELIIAKQRNGPTCTVRVAFHGPTTTFRPLVKGYEEFNDFGEDGSGMGYRNLPYPSNTYTPGVDDDE